MSNKREIILSVGLTRKIYEALLNETHKNKILNLKKQFKGEKKKPANINSLIRDILEKALFKE